MRKGFTLIELIVVVIVIAILASFAVPQYITSIERAKKAKAENALGIIAQAEKMYRAENDTYVNFASGAADATLGSYVELDEVDNDTDWNYQVTGATTTAFTATATRSGGSNNGETVTVDQSGNWGGDFTP
ncbi:MAG: prepilin-type N-terminal cleavage/methylation domain-containing protein [Candidatus Omnitrophica bacterium]|nr:prepilin-type N-terminal cleavage/methylation domain-containing protein [Candidatus Omnitrophota bacterium]MCF7891512.1 prepilin-type N-terminal cleavage/methylation domain-containing protein [Candidatus Omnitrophota bacterium]MCF7895775.1 prepilin-type N-terminal cleavage/methylation domain-containing protein [Candidatus Omnitrophota bacterium]MCF7897376.1 prepilin-type N-terminal cleavage/methylation domain-containing protein [Candidatus Omnitrophota bacterium]MCF7909517.1 prepilin-type N-